MAKPHFVDVHGHINFQAFADDYRAVIQRTLEQNVWLIMPGSQLLTSKRSVEISQEFGGKGVWAAVGHHPTHALDMPWDKADYDQLIRENRPFIKAIGETGIDYYRVPKDASEKEIYLRRQKEIFQEHLELAAEHELPLIIHCRDAYDDLYDMIHRFRNRLRADWPGLIHCFVGDEKTAKKFLDLGFCISFTGIITFTADSGLLQAVRDVPLDRLTVETDAPYLTPVPHRGKRNEPLYTQFVAAKVAELKGLTLEKVLQQTAQNSLTLFDLS